MIMRCVPTLPRGMGSPTVFSNKESVVVSTAHPAKFESVVEPEIGREIPVPESLEKMLSKESKFISITPDPEMLFTDLKLSKTV